MKCEICGNEHDGSYGSGRFCSNHCHHVYIGKQTKVHKCNFNARSRAPYGTWKCWKCDIIFQTKRELLQHNHDTHPVIANCAWNKGLTKNTDKRVLKSSQTLKSRYVSGEIVTPMKGKHHSLESRHKTRISTLEYLKSVKGHIKPRYNVNSIPIIEKYSSEYGWNMQHAENGGEINMFGFWLDGYDKEKNIIFEYDEPRHYIDVDNNILRQKDIDRQNFLIEKLHCTIYRFNEATGILWRVN